MLYVSTFPTAIYTYIHICYVFIIIQKREPIKVPDKALE